ncbi:MAG TPA: alpha/beta fold hydrolase [Frankiaceae bacterium]
MRVRPRMYVAAAVAALVGLITAVAAGATPAPPAAAAGVCRNVHLPVGLSARAPQNLALFGELCTPASGTPRTIQVLVHGATYSHTYWNFPGFDGRYSYSAAMNRAGYATLALDLLGVGGSSHPASLTVTLDTEAYAIHAAIQAARSGALGTPYARVLLVGHSLGTLTSDVEIATYHDVDGFIATGTSHGPGALGLARILSGTRPALLDPVTRPQVPAGDLGYLTIPGARTAFYAGGDVDPAVRAADEATRSPDPAAYAATLGPYLLATPLLRTNEITVPVLLVNGTGDAVFCAQGQGLSGTDCSSAAALRASEARSYGPAAHLATYVLPRAGHDINLVPNAQLWFAAAAAWCRQVAPA